MRERNIQIFGKARRKTFYYFRGIIKLTSRPEEWVESAEFGPREDY